MFCLFPAKKQFLEGDVISGNKMSKSLRDYVSGMPSPFVLHFKIISNIHEILTVPILFFIILIIILVLLH